ncbi:MAG: flagellar hook-basal body complex protein FliE [Alphaproteobacteria bacterium]
MAIIASNSAAAAYQAIQQGGVAAPAPTAPEGGAKTGGFAAVLEDAARSAVETVQRSEQTAIKAASGDAELLDIVTSVNDAEQTLRTVVAVRDKVVQSYQEILRMPI